MFDFGGGTCDVAILRVVHSSRSNILEMSPLAVSRYHRLGGGDIDAAIVYEALLPQIQEQNNLGKFDLDFDDKKAHIEPAFIGLAEALKIKMCVEIAQLRAFKMYEDSDKSQVHVRYPGRFQCKVKERALALQSPMLTAEQFEEILIPFLDLDIPVPRSTEYRMTCSIFAPLLDALERSNVRASAVDYVLMVGGSSLIPQVQTAVAGYFGNATALVYPDAESIQTAVARGAAIHSFALNHFGRGFIQPVAADSISVRTQTGLVELLPKGVPLPYPSSGATETKQVIAAPSTVILGSLDLRVEVVAGEGRLLAQRLWSIPGPFNEGEPFQLEYRLDENQNFTLEMRFANKPGGPSFEAFFVNPLTNVVNPNATRLQIDEIEEELRTGNVPRENVPHRLVELADKYEELGQLDHSIDILGRVLRADYNVNTLHKIALLHGRRGDYVKEEKFYQEAAKLTAWTGPLFNLALSKMKRNELESALAVIDEAIEREQLPENQALKADILEKSGSREKSKTTAGEALRSFRPIDALSNFELCWAEMAARIVGDKETLDRIEVEKQHRRKATTDLSQDKGELPITTRGIEKY